MRIEKSETLIQRAFFRKLAGNPPISSKKDTIGDEIIWESLLEHITDDLILISRDNTYKEYSTFLIDEYRNKTEKSLFITETLSEALKYVGEEPSDKLVQYEEEQKKCTYYATSAISDTLERLGSLAGAINRSHITSLGSIAETLDRSSIAGLDNLAGGIDRSHIADLGSVAETMNRSHIAGLNSLADAIDRSHIASLGSIAETMDRLYAAGLPSLAEAMEVPPAIRPSNIIGTPDALVGRFNDLSTGCDPDTSEWLERDVNEDQEECIPDKSSRKKDYTDKGTQVETKMDKDVEQ